MKIQDLYASVTAEVIKQLEDGVPPWVRPWKDSKVHGLGSLPSNLLTGRLYSGSNVLLLWMVAAQRGYQHLQYCTYDQANAMGARVRKGEKACHVIFTKRDVKTDENGEEKAYTLARAYSVFNLDQLENVPEDKLVPQVVEDDTPTNTRAVAIAKASGITFRHGGSCACYKPTLDIIEMPMLRDFESEDSYFGTLFHEITHATGHRARLNRDLSGRFGDEKYAAEELVAELGSAFTCARLGMQSTFRSASYIASWLKVLRKDNRAIFTASSYAGQAANWMWDAAFAEQVQEAAE